MNDENEKLEESGTDSGEQSMLAGQRLAEARRERQIAVLEVAKELHLDETKVRALENNEFESLGAPVFAKGHLRKYADLVGVDEKDVLADYYQLTRSESIPPVVANRSRPRREFSPGPWIAVVVVVAVVALAYWIMTRQPSPPAPAASQPAAEEPVPASNEQEPAGSGADEDLDEPTPTVAEEPDPEPEAETEPEPEPEPATEPEPEATAASQPAPARPASSEPLADGDVRLTIEFLGDCWTEIFDARGRRLYYNLGSDGQTVDVAGPGPLSVLFGDADNVSLMVNGEAFTIADADRSGRTARFALYGP